MLDVETIKNISTFVEITMQVEDRLRSKYEQKEEQTTEGFEDMKRACRDLDRQRFELAEQVKALEKQVKALEGQKERQAATITELKEKLEKYSEYPTFEILLETNEQNRLGREKAEKEVERLKKELQARQEMQPAGDKELRQKLDKAMDHIRRQGEGIDKLRAGAADPRWVPLRNRRPDTGVYVLTCTKRGTIYVAKETEDGWVNVAGKTTEPVAWMPLPKRYTGGEA